MLNTSAEMGRMGLSSLVWLGIGCAAGLRLPENEEQSLGMKKGAMPGNMTLTLSMVMQSPDQQQLQQPGEGVASQDPLIDLDKARRLFRHLLAGDPLADLQQEQQAAAAQQVAVQGRAERRLICMSVYGTSDKYLLGAVENARLAAKVFPGWGLRFYVATEVPEGLVQQLKASHEDVQVMRVKDSVGTVGMFWRFLVADDPAVDRFIIRDPDSRLNAREAAAVQEWVDSGKTLHTMRDHPYHSMAMMGGMWGATHQLGATLGSSMLQLIVQHGELKTYNDDQTFLSKAIREPPKNNDSLIEHDAFTCSQFGSRSFPTKRVGTQFVGQAFQGSGEVFVPTPPPPGGSFEAVLTDYIASHHGVPAACRRHADWMEG